MDKFKIYTRGIIFDEQRNNVLLLKKSSGEKIASGQWMLPGGTVEFGEDVELSLIREIKEETNLDVQSIQILTSKRMLIQNTHWLGVYYLVKIKTINALKNVEPEKHETVRFVPLKDVPDFKDYTVLQFIKTIDSNREIFDISTIASNQHAMGKALDQYVDIKIHSFIKSNEEHFSRIRIIGNHDRSVHVSVDEKDAKLFNYERPTVFVDSDILYVSCFPGSDYLYHYANLLKYYFESQKKQKLISYFDTSPTLIHTSFDNTNIHSIPDAEIIIFGNVDRLKIFENDEFEGDGDFMWKIGRIGKKSVMLLGCKFSIWGDLSYYLIQNLSHKISFDVFIYIGKLGSLNEKIEPNKYLATGKSSWIDGTEITWDNVFESIHINQEFVVTGGHVTCRSVMDETNENISIYQERGDFIDPEIGNMAKASNELGKQFSYLHIISDNVAKKHAQNLSNERKTEVRENRVKLFDLISEITISSIKKI